jgi:putative ABC transport system substrate-binding protein
MTHNQHRRKYMLLLNTISIIGALLLPACTKGQATYTVGVISYAVGLDAIVEGFKEGMAELGYTEGENVTYIYEGATDSIGKLDAIAQRLVAADVDLILSITTPATQAAQRATADTDIPLVFAPVTDPVGAGLVSSLRQPGGNTTGITFGAQEGRRLEWLIRVVPTIKKVYIPFNPEDRSAVLSLETVSKAAATLGVELITRETRTVEEVIAAIENMPQEADAIFLLPDSLVGSQATKFARYKLPTSAADPANMEILNMLTSYGMDLKAVGKQAARLVDQIFQGIKPADLPVETAEFYFAINLKTAKVIGLNIPSDILEQANIVVR